MNIFEKICRDMIRDIRKFYENDEIDKLPDYLLKKEIFVEKCHNQSKDVGEYVDTLVKDLK